MLILTPMPPVGLGQESAAAGNGKLAQAIKAVLVPFTQQVKSEILDPVEQKSGGLVFHVSPEEIRAAMTPVCGSGPALTGDVGTFLGVTRCWLEEAFGQWVAFEQIGLQAKAIGDALNSAALATETRAKQPPAIPSVVAAAMESARVAKTMAVKFVAMGQGMIQMALQQKTTVRQMRRLAPDIRDTVILFNDAIDTGEITTTDPAIANLKTGLEEIITGWRRMIVQQIDLALFAAKQAQRIVDVNNRFIAAQFDLALMTPELLALTDEMLRQIAELLDLISFMAMPGRALKGLSELPGDVVGGIVKALTDPATEALVKTAWVVAGLGVLAIGGAILLKKYGVIGKLKGD